MNILTWINISASGFPRYTIRTSGCAYTGARRINIASIRIRVIGVIQTAACFVTHGHASVFILGDVVIEEASQTLARNVTLGVIIARFLPRMTIDANVGIQVWTPVEGQAGVGVVVVGEVFAVSDAFAVVEARVVVGLTGVNADGVASHAFALLVAYFLPICSYKKAHKIKQIEIYSHLCFNVVYF